MGCILCLSLGATTSLYAGLPVVKPLDARRLEELIAIIQQPTRCWNAGRDGPPEGPPPTRNFRGHGEITELERAGPEAVEPLIGLLRDRGKHAQARSRAAAALTGHLSGYLRTPDPRVLPAVRAALKDADPAVREAALSGLSSRGKNCYVAVPGFLLPSKTAASQAVVRDILPDIVSALADEDAGVAMTACRALSSIGEPNSGVPELVAATKRPESEVRGIAAMTLSRVGQDHPAALPALMARLAHKDDLFSYAMTVGAVGSFGPRAKAAVPALIEAFKDKRGVEYPHLRRAAAFSLCYIGPDAKPALWDLVDYYQAPGLSMYREELLVGLGRIEPEVERTIRAIEWERQDAMRRQVEEELKRKRDVVPEVFP